MSAAALPVGRHIVVIGGNWYEKAGDGWQGGPVLASGQLGNLDDPIEIDPLEANASDWADDFNTACAELEVAAGACPRCPHGLGFHCRRCWPTRNETCVTPAYAPTARGLPTP